MRAMILCDVRRIELGKYGNFLYNILDFIVCILDVDDLDGYGLSCPLVDAIVSLALIRWSSGVSD